MLLLIHKLLFTLTRVLALVGAAMLMGGMLVTCADIVVRGFGNGIFGTTEMVQLAMLLIVCLAIPYTFMVEGHIGVEIFTDGLGLRVQSLVKAFAAMLGILFMSGIFWFGAKKALQKIEYGDVSMNLGIPLGYFWAPMLVGFGLSVLALALLATGHVLTALRGATALPPPPRPTLPD